MGVPIRQAARELGVSDAAVSKAIKTGRISAEPDGTIDVGRARRDWAANTNPAWSRIGQDGSRRPDPKQKKKPPRKAPLKGTAKRDETAIPAPADTATGQGTSPADAPEGTINLARARTAKMAVDAQLARLELQKAQGALVDAKAMRALWFTTLRTIPSRVAARCALETDPRKVQFIIEDEIQSVLTELQNDLRPIGGQPVTTPSSDGRTAGA
jgi:hypothetical protein